MPCTCPQSLSRGTHPCTTQYYCELTIYNLTQNSILFFFVCFPCPCRPCGRGAPLQACTAHPYYITHRPRKFQGMHDARPVPCAFWISHKSRVVFFASVSGSTAGAGQRGDLGDGHHAAMRDAGCGCCLAGDAGVVLRRLPSATTYSM